MRNPLRMGAKLGLIASCVAIALAVTSTAAIKRPIKKPTHDPAAEVVDLFEAVEAGRLEARLILKDEFEGNVFIENKTDKPLTVKLPRSVVGVQVLKQGFGPAGGMGNMGGNNNQNQGNGQAQASGGGFGQGGGGMGFGGGGMGFGGGFPSIPSEKVIQLPYTSVCLNHGKPSPRPAMTYKIVRTETYTKNPVLQELLGMIATGKVDRQVGQAAAWHLTDNMSWSQLASKKLQRIGADQPYFTPQQLAAAMSLVAQAEGLAKEKNGGELKTEKKL